MGKLKLVTNFPDDGSRPRTARNWAVQGYLVKEGAVGEEMYCNRSWSRAIYYYPDDVYLASAEELAAYWKTINAEHAARQRERRRRKRETIERATAPLQDYLNEHRESKDRIVQAICRAARNAIQDFKRYRGAVPVYTFFNVVLPLSETDADPVHSDVIVLDTETTGLSPNDGAEILQLSIINQDGAVLFDEYFKPVFAKSWGDAMAINHISPDDVADKPTIYERLHVILPILQGAKLVVGYNTPFDLFMLDKVGAVVPKDTPVVDVMRSFAPIYGAYNEQYGSYTWQKLTTCAAYYGYDWGRDKAHDSLADCRATLFCYLKMQELSFADDF